MAPINKAQLPKTPSALLQQWIDDAFQAEIALPKVGSLATALLPSGRISNRMVNVRGLTDSGNIQIFSDFNLSRKGRDLNTNPRAALTFWWQKLDRSVRVEGQMKFLSLEESRPYFEARDAKFRASVLIGEQSQPVETRKELVDKLNNLLEKPESELKMPNYWSGAELVPDWVEFYQGSPDRISDRIAYTLEGNEWRLDRISP